MSKFFPIWWKEKNELYYWKRIKIAENEMRNLHYEFFYTKHFEIEKSWYDNKVLLDIGCGPRGSLEWAKNAKRRIGIDPLATEYLKLGADKHEMDYISSGSEQIPLNDAECDAIFSFNSLDHVENVSLTIGEIKRCLASNGVFLLLVEVNHPATACEPHTLSPKDIMEQFSPELEVDSIKLFKPKAKGLYESIKLGDIYSDPINCKEIGWFSAKFIKKD